MTYQRKEQIGNCTLYLGDCREILPTLDKADAVVTDPPYSVSVSGSGRWEMRYGRTNDLDFFAGDNDWHAMTETVLDAVAHAVELLHAHGSVYVWCSHRQFGRLVDCFESRGWSTRFLVWSKKHPVPAAPGAGWPSAAELCIYAYRAGRRWSWKGSCPYRTNVFTVDSYRHGQPGKVEHPTQKPMHVIYPLIVASSYPGDMIVDPFMGSGTTGVCCATMHRSFIGIEIDEGYFDIACQRIEDAYRQGDMFLEAP